LSLSRNRCHRPMTDYEVSEGQEATVEVVVP